MVGDEDLVAVALDIAKGELGPGWGSSRRTIIRVPSPQSERSTKSVISAASPAHARRCHRPRWLGASASLGFGHHGRHVGTQRVADDEADTTRRQASVNLCEQPGRIGPGDHLAAHWVDRELGQGVVEHDDMIIWRFPAPRCPAARGGQWSPVASRKAMSVKSRNRACSSGPPPLLSECAPTKRGVEVDHVEARVQSRPPRLRARAAARAEAMRSRAAASMASRVRQVVGTEATSPKRPG